MCKGKICPNFDSCKCNKSKVDYTSEKYKDLIPSTTSPRNLLNRGETSEQH